MRDIRDDLQERVEAAEKKRDDLLAQAKEQEELIATLKRVLELEEAPASRGRPSNGHAAAKPPEVSASEYILQLVRQRPRTKEEIRDLVEEAGYYPEAEAIGRAVHFTIVNMTHSGKLRESHGRYFEGNSE